MYIVLNEAKKINFAYIYTSIVIFKAICVKHVPVL